MNESIKIVFNLPYLFKRCVLDNDNDTILALSQMNRFFWNLIEGKRINITKKEICCSIYFEEDTYLSGLYEGISKDFSANESFNDVPNLFMPDVLHKNCLQIVYEGDDQDIEVESDDDKNEYNNFRGASAMRMAKETEIIVQKLKNVTFLDLVYLNVEDKVEYNNFLTFMNVFESTQITKLYVLYENLLTSCGELLNLSTRLPNVKLVIIGFRELTNVFPEIHATLLVALSEKFNNCQFKFVFDENISFDNFALYSNVFSMINKMKTINANVDILQNVAFKNMYDSDLYAIGPLNMTFIRDLLDTIEQSARMSFDEMNAISLNLVQLYGLFQKSTKNEESLAIFSKILFSATNKVRCIKADLNPNFTTDFAKQLSERYPDLKALGVDKIGHESALKNFKNLEVLIVKTFTPTIIIPSTVRIVVQRCDETETNTNCIFINQDDNSQLIFNNKYIIPNKYIPNKRNIILTQRKIDWDLYEHMKEFVDFCLFDGL